MRMMRMRFFVLLLAAGFSLAASAENIADYPRRAVIETEGEATWYRAEIPAFVQWQAAHADLRDLRVFNANGESLPFALTRNVAVHRATEQRREVSARLFPLYGLTDAPAADEGAVMRESGLRIRRDRAGNVQIDVAQTPAASSGAVAPRPGKVLRGWLLDAGALDFAPERMTIRWAGKDEGFFHFSIAASDDLEHWSDWGEGQIVHFAYEGQSIDRNEIPLPKRKARYLRLLWQDAGQAAGVRGVRLAGADTGLESVPGQIVWSAPLTGEAVAERENEFIWRFSSRLQPLRVSVLLDEDDNTLTPVIFSGRDFYPPATQKPPVRKPHAAEVISGERRLRDVIRERRHERRAGQNEQRTWEAPWQVLASGVLYRLNTRAGVQSATDYDLSPTSINQLRLQIDPRGGVSAGRAPRIKIALQGVELTFLARGRAPYRIGFGRADAQAANLPLSTLIPAGVPGANDPDRTARARIVETVETTPVQAAMPVAAADAVAASESAPDDGNRKAVLWAVLLAGAVLLGGMAFSLLRGSKQK